MSDIQISVHHPDLPDDTMFEIEGVGEVQNGGTLTVTDEQQESFSQENGYELSDALAESPIIGVGGEEPNVDTGKLTPNEERAREVQGEPEPVVEAEVTPEVAPTATRAKAKAADETPVVEEGGEK